MLAGSLDHPDRVPPVIQYGIETEVPWVRHLPELPGQRLYEDDPKGYLPRITATNRQHPDHDTAEWPRMAEPGSGQ